MCSQVKKTPNTKWERLKYLDFICSLTLWHHDFRCPQFLLILAYFCRQIHFIYSTVAMFFKIYLSLSVNTRVNMLQAKNIQ